MIRFSFDLQTCFVFSSYTSLYQFGMCREWVDVDPHSDGSSSRVPSLRGDLGNSLAHAIDFSAMIGAAKTPLAPVNNMGNVGRCKSCERKQSCSSCLLDLGCGWCYYAHNPLIGLCKPGDFNAPAIGKCRC